MKRIKTGYDCYLEDFASGYTEYTVNSNKKKFTERIRYISRIPFKTGTKLLMTPKPPFAEFKTVEEYMMSLYSEGVETIVVFLESREEAGLLKQYKEAGFNVIHFPIRDFNTPHDMGELSRVLHEIRKALAKHSVAMHCFGGNGRTGLVVASMFVQMGLGAKKAIEKVRSVRPEAIETPSQEKFIHDFEFFERFVK